MNAFREHLEDDAADRVAPGPPASPVSTTLIFKLVATEEWLAAELAGAFEGAAVDRADGYDEKPGIQAIATTAPDLPPEPGRHATLARDHEEDQTSIRREHTRSGWLKGKKEEANNRYDKH